jgi:hypothetical protein
MKTIAYNPGRTLRNTNGYRLANAVGKFAGVKGNRLATQYGIQVVAQGKGAIGIVQGAFGLDDTSVQGRISTLLTVAGFVPGIGELVAGASVVNDIIKAGIAVAKCP